MTTERRIAIKGYGLLGVCRENFLTPSHNKASYVLRETIESSAPKPELLFKKMSDLAEQHLSTAVAPMLSEILGQLAPKSQAKQRAKRHAGSRHCDDEEETAAVGEAVAPGRDDGGCPTPALNTTEQWAECDGCGKWRRLGTAGLCAFQRCGENPDLRFASCEVAQELTDEKIDQSLGLAPAAAGDLPAPSSVEMEIVKAEVEVEGEGEGAELGARAPSAHAYIVPSDATYQVAEWGRAGDAGASGAALRAAQSQLQAQRAREAAQAQRAADARKAEEAARAQRAVDDAVVEDAWMLSAKDGRKGYAVRAGRWKGRQLFQLRDQSGSLGAKKYGARPRTRLLHPSLHMFTTLLTAPPHCTPSLHPLARRA